MATHARSVTLDGRLVAAGGRWSEHRDLRKPDAWLSPCSVCMAGIVGLVVSMLTARPPSPALLLLGLGIWLRRRSFRIAGRKRELVFRSRRRHESAARLCALSGTAAAKSPATTPTSSRLKRATRAPGISGW